MRRIFLKFFLIILPVVAFFCMPALAGAAQIGEQASFFVDSSYDAFSRATLKATLIIEGEHAYFYVENDWWNGLADPNVAKAAIQDLKNEFDVNVYPKMTKVYGSLWEPGIDNDPKITILISRMREGAGGYFNSADEYARNLAANSNEHEMLYLNSLYFNITRAKSFLAHEFQHLITFYQKERLYNKTEDLWLNEARSEYAPTLLGYDDSLIGSNLEKRIIDFLRNPSDSLTEWTNLTVDYGSANLFIQYLVNHYGEQVLGEIMRSPDVGIASIDDALTNLNTGVSFADVFHNWMVANNLNNCGLDQRYCYGSNILDQILIWPTMIQTVPSLGGSEVSFSDSVKDWSGRWYELVKGNSNYDKLKIDFQSGGNFTVIYISKNADGSAQINFIRLDANNKGQGFVRDFGSKVKSVVLIPISQFKRSFFGSQEDTHQFSFQASLTNEDLVLPDSDGSVYPDGALLRAKGDYKVYVVNGAYKRWIQSSEFFKFYPHLGWASVVEVAPEDLAKYKETSLVRADGDTKVYEINGDGTKHWLNMTAQQFSQSGRKWDMVSIINNAERDFYRTGVNVMFK
ncbi:MAG: hypothetical protein V1845_02925 [bacterium]